VTFKQQAMFHVKHAKFLDC